MHFFCIFLQKYLVISKKSIIFVPDLEIVPSITKNNVKSMTKECIFKAWGGNCWLRVLAIKKKPDAPVVYRVMMDRCLLDGVNEFEQKGVAIDKAASLARLDAMYEKGGWRS